MKTRNRTLTARKQPWIGFRKRVTAAFRAMARGVDPTTAYRRTKQFYRSAGGEWTRALA